jgi:penicillin-binding protein 2
MFRFKKNEYRVGTRAKEEIQPEEIFLDADLERGTNLELTDSRMEKPISNRVFTLLFGLMFLVFALSLVRAFEIQVVDYDQFSIQALSNRSRVIAVAAPRGLIYDRNLNLLAANKPSLDLVVFPSLLPIKKEIKESLAQSLAEILDRSEIKERLINLNGDSFQPLILASGIDIGTQVRLEQFITDWPALHIIDNVLRFYPEDVYSAHILGYTSLVNPEEVDSDSFSSNTRVGRSGIEFVYNSLLGGEVGFWRIDLDSTGEFQSQKVVKPPQPGANLVLSIDIGLQKKLQEELEKQMEAWGEYEAGAAAVAINPKNGEVLALVSLPTFNNNDFEVGISQQTFQEIIDNPRRPLFNRALTGLYPPGSSIKPYIAVGALEEKIVTSKTIIDASAGQITIPNPYFPGRYEIFLDWKKHGLVDLYDAIADSVNVYFYTVGGGYGDIEGLGPDRIKQYEEFFGFGRRLGIDLPSEAMGVLPSPEWKTEQEDGNFWRLGDTYNISIGQGDVLITPLQLAAAVSVIANGGILYQPHVLKGFTNEGNDIFSEKTPEIIRQIRDEIISSQSIDEVRLAMRETTRRGSAASLSILPVTSAGKTGTAQYGRYLEKTHGWFSAFAPFEEPEIAVAVIVEGSKGGTTAAVPVVREVFKWYFNERN